MAGNNEHIFVTNLVANGSSAVFKQNSEMNVSDVEKTVFKVYPNPANDYVTIESREQSGFSYTLYSSYGQAISSGNSSGETIQVNTTKLAAGIYMLHLTGSKNEVSRIVISK